MPDTDSITTSPSADEIDRLIEDVRCATEIIERVPDEDAVVRAAVSVLVDRVGKLCACGAKCTERRTLAMPDADKLLSRDAASEIDRLIREVRGLALVVQRACLDDCPSCPTTEDDAQWTAIHELVDRIDKLCVRWGEVY